MRGKTKPNRFCGSDILPFKKTSRRGGNYSASNVLGSLSTSCNLASARNLRAAYNGFEVVMSYQTDEPIKLTRDCQVVAVPAGHTLMLPQGTEVMITQSLGGSYTLLVPSYG